MRTYVPHFGLLVAALLVIGAAAPGAQTCVIPDSDSIIAWWTFDDTTSSIAHDLKGNHDGVLLNGASYISGKVSNGVSFDGNNDYIGVPDDDVWAFGYNNFTIEFWAKLFAYGGGAHNNLIFIGSSNGPGETDKWWFGYGGPSQPFFGFWWSHTATAIYATVPYVPVLGQWYHLAVSRSGDTLSVFINGVPSGYQVVPGLFIYNPNAPLTIGSAEGIGFVNGTLDEMTVYNRALSDAEILAIYNAGTAGKCKVLQISTPAISDAEFGKSFSQTLEAVFGVPPLTWSLAAGALPAGITLSAGGVLSGTPSEAGEFSFTAQVMDSTGTIAQKAFALKVLLTLPEAEITVFKSGTVAVPGREIDYFILVENVGSVTIDSVRVEEYLQHWFTLISSSPIASVDLEIPNYYTKQDTTDMQPWVISWNLSLRPGESSVLSYKVKLQPSFPVNEFVTGGDACAYGEEVVCTYEESTTTDQAGLDNCLKSNEELYESGTPIFEQSVLNCYRHSVTTTGRRICTCEKKPTQGAVDPNEKLVLSEKYIKEDQLLPYVIHFENIGTIEARDVFITDTLDENLDETTLNIISSAGASFDPVTRVLKWDLLNINLLPDNSAYVMYTIKPKPNLPSGTVIKNRAYIQFEVFDVFPTQITENIIDLSTPEGVMNALPDTMCQTAFPISWSGTDAVGEIKSYSIFVAQDSGAYTKYLTTNDTTAIFTGEAGKTYSFICIAEDFAGNIEKQESVAEATTHLTVPCGDSNTYSNTHAYTYTHTNTEPYSYTDCLRLLQRFSRSD